MTAREHHHRRHTPHRAATRHGSDTTRQKRNEKRVEERSDERDEENSTRRLRHEMPTRRKTRRNNETISETPPRDEQRDAPYILKADHWPRKSLSTFSTMREYNTDTERRMTPSHEIHNIDTMDTRCPYTELMFVRHARKKGVPLYRRRPIARGRYAC